MKTKKINWLAFLLEDGGMSMGRIMAWVMFGILVYMWITDVVVPETLITGFYVLLSYNFSKKLLPFAAFIPKKDSSMKDIEEDEPKENKE